jgi:hypothetical protein
MHLVELFVPMNARSGDIEELMETLARRFGGATAHIRSPADGFWHGKALEREPIGIIEVMTPELDRDWWRALRADLERRFDQEEILIRATPCEKI